MKKVSILFFLLLLNLNLWACFCNESSANFPLDLLTNEKEEEAVLFLGEVIDTYVGKKGTIRFTKFRILKRYQGAYEGREIVIETMAKTSCSLGFSKEYKWLIHARKQKEAYRTDYCDWHKSEQNYHATLAFFDWFVQQKNGPSTFYYNNKKLVESEFKHGQLHGKTITYDYKKGDKLAELNYQDNQLQGKSLKYIDDYQTSEGKRVLKYEESKYKDNQLLSRKRVTKVFKDGKVVDYTEFLLD